MPKKLWDRNSVDSYFAIEKDDTVFSEGKITWEFWCVKRVGS